MPISPSDFLVSLSPIPLQAVIGFDTTGTLSFSNTNATEKAYNLAIVATIPDGVSFVSANLPPTQIVNNPDSTITLSWINIKDLAPNELNYQLGITLHSDDTFRATGLQVPFDTPLVAVNISGTVDTLPRGNDDPGNQKITKNVSSNFIPLRYNLIKSGPGKMPKGAGLLAPPTAPRWPYTYTLTVQNNVRIPSTVSLVDNLPNGIRYLDTLTVVGPDSVALSAPAIIAPPVQDFVNLNWGTITLSPLSTNVITYEVAIWDNYTVGGMENSGSRILHMTPLTNSATLNGASGTVTATRTTNAMDATIDKSVVSGSTDVGVTNNYTLTYRINQYDPVNGFTVTDTLSDGQSFITGVPYPDSVTVGAGVTTLVWSLGNLSTGTQGNIVFSSITNANYVSPAGPVSAGDTLTNGVTVNGTNANFGTPTPDSSSVSLTVAIPNLTKQILAYFYKNGTPKTYSITAPGDFVEFRLDYDASTINASQLGITIDDFFPYNMGPLTGIPITYGGTVPAPPPPVTIDPHGLRWTLGTLPGNSTFSATFQVQVENIDFVGSLNNLGKLSGINTAGLAYSDRDQVAVTFGTPNITLSKNVTGPDVNAIKAGETYVYSITVANPQNATNSTVDAFDFDLTDAIPTGLTYVPGSISVSGTGSYNPPTVVGQNITLHILQLPPAGSLTLTYSVTVNPTIGAGQTFINNANTTNPYSQPFTGSGDYQYTGQARHAETTLRSKGVSLSKTPSPVFAKIGDTVTYIMTVTVPQGTTAYNLQLVDNYPSATQLYLDNATKDGLPIVPVQVPGTVTFPLIPSITALANDVIITYTFDIRVTGGTHVSPFIENQINQATVSWDISPGVPATPVTVTSPLQVRTPNLTGRKEQRNVTGGVFTVSNVQYSPGDVIQYRLNLTNNGAETAFDTVLTDVLNPLLSFNAGSFSANLGTPSFAAGTVTWNIPQIGAGITATLTFTVTTLPGVPSAGTIPDSATFIYNTNNNGFGISYSGGTNTVRIQSPRVTITKTGVPTVGQIGDDITYTLTVTVPAGTIAYKVTVDDTLPAGQTYIGPATRQVPPGPPVVIPTSLIGQNVSFLDGNLDINASAGAVTIIYSFIARITNATHNPPFSETQTDSGRVRWATVSGGSLSQQATASVDITAQTPNITILKEQQNVSTGGSFTTANIIGLPGNTIYYRFTITSNGASPAYNINLTDILDPFLTYNGVISISAGTVTPPGPSLGWNIPILNNGATATLVISVTIAAGIGAGGTIHDSATATYDSNDVNPVTYNAASNSVTINIPNLSIAKTALPTAAAIGDIITYTITVSIPNGVAAHNLIIRDVFPTGQTYVSGSWAPGPPPVQTSNKLTYTNPVTPEIGPLALVYTFQTQISSATLSPPYTETQTNCVEVQWDITPAGPTAPPVSTTADITINSPHLTLIKEQRNTTTGGSFTADTLTGVAVGDILEYRLTLTNVGTGTAYNIIVNDALNAALTYQAFVAPFPPGTVVSSVPFGTPDGTITWSNFSLGTGLSAVLVISVLVNPGYAPGSNVSNQASAGATTNPAGVFPLQPTPSNQVNFNFVLPLITKTADRDAVFLGDTVTYTVAFTILLGHIAYNVQVTDALPAGQSYVPDSLTRNSVPIIPSPTLTFPFEGTVDATAAQVTITYTFQATVTSLVMTPQDIQIDSAVINWTLDPAGINPGPPQTAAATVYATNSDIFVHKEQLNFTQGGGYATAVIQSAPGNEIHYRLTATNPSASSIYNVTFTDVLSAFLGYNGLVAPPPAGVVSFSGGPAGGTVTWNIAVIPAGITYQAEFSVIVLPGAGAAATIPDQGEATFTATSGTPLITYGPRQTNTVLQQVPNLQFTKSAPSGTVELGTVITYTLTVTVPAGIKAYNLVVEDTLPSGQTYADQAIRNGVPIVPSVSGQVITFPLEPVVDASAGQLIINYAFKAQVVTGQTDPPFTITQTNNASLNWDTSPGFPATPLTATQDIIITSPFSVPFKAQSNVTKGTGFITEPLDVEVGDIVSYKIRVTSSGASPAYNTVVTDVLGPYKAFLGVLEVTAGSVTGGPTVTWTIPFMAPGTEEFLVFEVQILPGISAGGTDSNTASEIYDTNPSTPITLGPTPSDTVVVVYPNVRISKTADQANAAVGNIITYTVTFTLPLGTIAYNGQFTDSLHVGQEYNDNATLNGVPVTPDSVSGQVIVFPKVPFASAGATDLNFTYQFQALVVSANVNPITLTEVQTNEAVGHWELFPGFPAPPVDDMVDVTVTNSSVILGKAQRNASRDEIFTQNTVKAIAGEIIEYQLSVTNTGPNTVFNLTVTDNLATNLKFIAVISSPIGTVTYSDGSFDGTVTFSIPFLNSGDTVTAVFSVQVIAEILTSIDNFVTGMFNILPTDPTPYQAVPSNVTVIEIERTILVKLNQSECILINKVYSQCQQRICLEKVQTEPPAGYNLTSLSYGPGKIIAGSLQITYLEQRPGFSRVLLDITIPFEATFTNPSGDIVSQSSNLPDFNIDTILYLPISRSETQFDVSIDTRSTTLAIDGLNSTFAVGIIVVISVTGLVQLLIPSYGFCDDCCDCEEYKPSVNSACSDFLNESKTPFPEDFYK